MPGSLTYFPAAVCRLLGIEPPRLAQTELHPAVSRALSANARAVPVQRMLVYAPDAIGRQLLNRYPDSASRLRGCAPVEAELSSVDPAKTPVCFTSMLTGAVPQVHGIRRYERPPVTCDTLFDALVRAGRQVALVAVRNSSFDIMFRGRALDYFSEEYDPEVTRRALGLIAAGVHDFILVYHQEYDDLLHKTQPFSADCIAAFKRHVTCFGELSAAVDSSWGHFSRAVAFTPDHGAHLSPASGRGDHGLNIPEDMELTHYWGIRPGS